MMRSILLFFVATAWAWPSWLPWHAHDDGCPEPTSPLSFEKCASTAGKKAECLDPKAYSAAVLVEMDSALASWTVKSESDGTAHGTSERCTYSDEGCDLAIKVLQDRYPFGDDVPGTLWASRLSYSNAAERAARLDLMLNESSGLFSGYNFEKIDCTALGQFKVADLLTAGAAADGFTDLSLRISRFDTGSFLLGEGELLTLNSREKIADDARVCTVLPVISVSDEWAKEKGGVDDLYAQAPAGYGHPPKRSNAFYVSADVVCDYPAGGDAGYIEVVHVQTTAVGGIPRFALPLLALFGLFDATYLEEATKFAAYMRAGLGGAPYLKEDYC